jgi:hypothetical protein
MVKRPTAPNDFMETPPVREVLLVVASGRGGRQLGRQLELAGFRVDLAQRATDALDVFYRRGGHQACVIGPHLPVPEALDIVSRLRGLAPSLPILVPDSVQAQRQDDRSLHALPSFHLFARAGMVAVLRELLARLGTPT